MSTTPSNDGDKNQTKVRAGRKGGKRGGPSRARKLSSKRRSQIATEGAQARWGGKRSKLKRAKAGKKRSKKLRDK